MDKIKSYLKEFLGPFLMVMLVLVLFNIFSKFNLGGLIFIVSLLLLIAFIKNTKLLFYMFIISLPFTGTGWSFRMGETGFFFQMSYFFFILVSISFFFNKLRTKDYSFSITHIDLPLFSFLIVAAVSVFQTTYISNTPLILYDAFRNYPWIRGFLGVMFLVFMFGIYYITVNIVSERGMFKNTLIVFMITAVIASSYGLAGFLYTLITSLHLPVSIDPLISSGLRIRSVFNEPLFFGNYILSIIPVFYCLLISKTEYLNKYLLVVASSILTISLVLTESKGAWLAYLLFMFLFVIIYRKNIFKSLARISFVAFLLLILILLVCPILFSSSINEKINEVTNTLIWSSRIRMWSMQYAWEGFKQHPLLGIGYSNYIFYSGYRVYYILYGGVMNFPEVNNYPLKILTEMGLIGFIVLIWLFVKTIKSAATSITYEKDKAKKTMITGYLLAFIAVSIQLLFFSYINLAYMWVMLAMMVSLYGTKTIDFKKVAGPK